MTCRSWCFTLYDVELDLFTLFGGMPHCRYAVWQRESCPDTHREHFQGYIEFHQPVRMSVVKSVLGGAHIESRRGSREQARDYCRKEESRVEGPWEFGTWTPGGQGARSDLLAVACAISGGKRAAEIADLFPVQFIKFHRGIEKLIEVLHPVAGRDNVSVTMLIGKPDTGKSHFCKALEGAYWYPPGKWLCNYQGELIMVLDEFRGNWMCYQTLLRLLDSTPLMMECKGGHSPILATSFFITSNLLPDQWYPNQDFSPLERRVTTWIYCVSRDEHTICDDFNSLVNKHHFHG